MSKPTRSSLPAIIPREEICPLVDDDQIEQVVQRIQREGDANYEPDKVLGMAREFNRQLDSTIEKLNTMPPKEQPVIEPPQLLDFMVTISRFTHILERFIQKKNQRELTQ